MDKYIGQTIGVYEILSLCENKTKDNHKLYKCRCKECGFVRETRISDLNKEARYHVRCNHLRKDGSLNRVCDKKTWFKNPDFSRRYSDMLSRCYDERSKDYRFYGAKGIKVCEEWLNNPKAFEKFCEETYNGNLCLNRINVEGDYSPENCQWENREETARHKTSTNYYHDGDETLTGKQLSSKYSLGVNNFNKYFRKNNISEEDVTPEIIANRVEHMRSKDKESR